MSYRENRRRFSLPPRYGLIIAWLVTALGIIAAMRFTAITPLAMHQ